MSTLSVQRIENVQDFDFANTPFVTAFNAANGAYDASNASYLATNTAYNFANSVNTFAYGVAVNAAAAFDVANNALPNVSNAVFAGNLRVTGNLQIGTNTVTIRDNHIISAEYYRMNTANHMVAIPDGNRVNTIFSLVNVSFDTANASFASANNVGPQIAPTYNTANAAFDAANTKFSSSGGTISGAVEITADLTVHGNTRFVDQQTLQVGDPLIYLAANNYASDVVDIGFIANYVNTGGANVHTGLYRSSGTKEYYLFYGYDKEPLGNYIDPTGNNITKAILNADIRTSNLILGGANTINWIGAAYGKANAALANTSGVSFNGSLYLPSGDFGVGVSTVQASAASKTIEASGCLITGGPINSHQTNRGVFEFNANKVSLRAYGANAGDGYLAFNTGGGGGSSDTERMRITGTGYVGIGTSSPGANVDIYAANTGVGQAGASNLIFRVRDGQDRPPIAAYGYIDGTGFPDSTATAVAIRQVSGTGRSLTTTGSVMFGGTGTSTSDFRAPIFYDSDNTAYYSDPHATSNFNALNILNGYFNNTGLTLQLGAGISTTSALGIGFNATDTNYAIYKPAGAWTKPLYIYFYTGIRNYSHSSYDYGQSFWNISTGNLMASFGQGDNHTRINYNLYAPIMYDLDNTGYYVDPASTTTSLQIAGSIEQGNNLARPLARWDVASASTGMVIFYLPGTTSNYGMIHAVFDIYEYSGNHAATVIVGGHNWSTAWYNYGANVIGFTDKQVRLGVKDGKFCIIFGTSGSSWSYGQIVLRKIHNGLYYDNLMNLGDSYTITQTTTESFTWVTGDLRELRTPGTFSTGSRGITKASMPAGTILQVQQAFYTAATTLASGTFTDYPGLSVTITPSSSSSKFLLVYHLQMTLYGTTIMSRFLRNGSAIGVGDAAGSRNQSTTGWLFPSGDSNHQACPMVGFYLDSPATASAITYKVQAKTQSGGTAYINYAASNADNSDWAHRSTSSFTIFEVAV